MENHNVKLAVIIMIVSSFILSYYVTESISLKKNITNNMHKFYMGLFMAVLMGMIELCMYYYFSKSFDNYYLFVFLIICIIFFGYKLRTLNFLDDKQFLLSMIEHHENAIVMANAHNKYYKTNNPELINLINNIQKNQTDEINLMYRLLEQS